jgi:KipI family sensor histidine kinase inhibitor
MKFPRIHPLGDSAMLVQFDDVFSMEANAKALALDRVLSANMPMGVVELVPTIASLMIRFDPLETSYLALQEICQEAIAGGLEGEHQDNRTFIVPAIYGGQDGPDLAEVADLMGVSDDQAIASHSETTLQVMMLGFAPGCSYLGLLSEAWNIPRGTKINPQVPAGALLVALRQVVFPGAPMPTGWRQIGRAPVKTFDVARDPVFALSSGDKIRFEPISVKKAAFVDDSLLWTAEQ